MKYKFNEKDYLKNRNKTMIKYYDLCINDILLELYSHCVYMYDNIFHKFNDIHQFEEYSINFDENFIKMNIFQEKLKNIYNEINEKYSDSSYNVRSILMYNNSNSYDDISSDITIIVYKYETKEDYIERMNNLYNEKTKLKKEQKDKLNNDMNDFVLTLNHEQKCALMKALKN